MMVARRVLAAGIALVASAAAVQAQTRPAPAYFMQAVTTLQAAQLVAQGCPSLSLDEAAVQSGTAQVMQRLVADGFDVTRQDAGLTMSQASLDAAQAGFREHHGLTGSPSEAQYCAAGRSEIAGGSLVGSYLSE